MSDRPLEPHAYRCIILTAILLVIVLLPGFTKINDPHLGWRAHQYNGKVYSHPLAPGVIPHFWLGTDGLGRDYAARLIHGARFTLGLTLLITFGRALLGVPIGIWAGWRGGLPARICSSIFGGLSALPSVFLMLVVLTGLRYIVHRPSDWLMVYVVVMILARVPRFAEQVRQQAMQVKIYPFVEGAVAIGAPTHLILRRYYCGPYPVSCSFFWRSKRQRSC